MNFLVIVLIAAVTVNCLVTTINGKEATDTLTQPYIDMLLPPLKDEQDNSSKEASAKINATTKATSVYKTTTMKAATSTTTKKSLTNDGKNILPELSIDALLPPLYEAKIVEELTTTSAPRTTTTKVTTTSKATTTIRPTYSTTKRITTTAIPIYTTTKTTSKPNLKVPDLFLDPLQPPLSDNLSADVKDEKVTRTTTQKPITKTTQKLYRQQQIKHKQANTAENQIKNYNKPAFKDKNVAETQTYVKQVSLSSYPQDNKLQSNDEKVKQQHVVKQKAANSNYVDKKFKNSFDLYFGSTTPRPLKMGLPTITPFPHRLGR